MAEFEGYLYRLRSRRSDSLQDAQPRLGHRLGLKIASIEIASLRKRAPVEHLHFAPAHISKALFAKAAQDAVDVYAGQAGGIGELELRDGKRKCKTAAFDRRIEARVAISQRRCAIRDRASRRPTFTTHFERSALSTMQSRQSASANAGRRAVAKRIA